MIDIDKIIEEFDAYISNFDLTDINIKLKYEHSKRVMNHSLNIAKSIGLDEEGQRLASLIGLLHDVGRFPQLTNFNTYNDYDSFDHGDIGEKLLRDGLLRKFIDTNIYDEIIFKAVKNHNKYSIEDGLLEDELLFSKIIRDADKLDIFYVVYNRSFMISYGVDNIGFEIISEDNFKRIMNYEQLICKDGGSHIEHFINVVAMIFDLNFIYSLEYVRDNDLVNKYLDKITVMSDDNKNKIDAIRDRANSYIKDNLSN